MTCEVCKSCMALGMSVVGISLSTIIMAAPSLIYFSDKKWPLLQPGISMAKERLENEYQKKVITRITLDNLIIFLDSFSEDIERLVLVVAAIGAANLFLDCMAVLGSCYDIR